MAKKEWIKIEDMAEILNVPTPAIYQNMWHDRIPKEAYRKISTNTMDIDKQYFIRRHEFKVKIQMRSHEQYYFLARHLSDYAIARIMSDITGRTPATWSSFIAHNLFLLQESGLKTKVFPMMWEFFRATRGLINRLFRKLGVPPKNRDLSILIERD